jgi:ABC-2 type transport system ATP-binding protein
MTVSGHFAFLRAFQPRWNDALATELLARLRVDPGQKIGKLSKGTRVKVGFIVAESIEPLVLLLDEPTSGLDPVIRGELLEIVDERLRAHPERVLIFSTHILEDIDRIAQRVLVLSGGRLVDDLPVGALTDGTRSVAQSLYERIRTNA